MPENTVYKKATDIMKKDINKQKTSWEKCDILYCIQTREKRVSY